MSEEKCLLKPAGDRILIRPNKIADKTKGGIVLPGNAQGPQTRGRVVAVGPGRLYGEGKLMPVAFKVGDDILYWPGAASNVEVGGEKLVMVPECEVLGTYVD